MIGLLKRLRTDEKGGSLEVLLAVILLMFIFFTTLEPVVMSYRALMLESAKMKGLNAMQIRGGLDPTIETSLKNYLKAAGFDESKITISGTLAKVNWGDEVGLEINYTDTINRYTRTNVISFEKTTETVTYHIEGSTTSYYFDNN